MLAVARTLAKCLDVQWEERREGKKRGEDRKRDKQQTGRENTQTRYCELFFWNQGRQKSLLLLFPNGSRWLGAVHMCTPCCVSQVRNNGASGRWFALWTLQIRRVRRRLFILCFVDSTRLLVDVRSFVLYIFVVLSFVEPKFRSIFNPVNNEREYQNLMKTKRSEARPANELLWKLTRATLRSSSHCNNGECYMYHTTLS